MDPWLQFCGRLHPLLLHVPIGAFVLLTCFELVGRLRRKWALAAGTRAFLVFLLAVTTLASAASGWVLADELGYSDDAFVWHRAGGIALAACGVLMAFALLLRKPGAYAWLLFLGLLALVPTGHFGATLTHGEDYLSEPFRAPAAPAAIPSSTPPALASNANAGDEDPDAAPAAPAVSYTAEIAPIFAARCGSCHGAKKQKGKLALHDAESVLAGGYTGAVIAPGDPAASELLRRLRLPAEDEDHMPPPSRPQPTAAEIDAIEAWIEAGAPFDTVAAGAAPAVETPAPEPLPSSEEDEDAAAPPPESDGPVTPPGASLEALQLEQVHVETLDPSTGLLWIDFAARPATDDAFARAHLEPLGAFVAELSLRGTAVHDALLPALAAMPQLARLDLTGTACTSRGLSSLRDHPTLASLNLTGTDVDDSVLDTLAQMPALQRVYLWRTGVTPSAALALGRSRPDLRIETGAARLESPLETEAPVQWAAAPSLRPVNTACPVTGNPVDPAFRIVDGDRVLGFCCADCPPRYWAQPDAYSVD